MLHIKKKIEFKNLNKIYHATKCYLNTNIIKEIVSDLEENKEDNETLKYLIKYKYKNQIIKNYESDSSLKNLIKNNENIRTIFNEHRYRFYNEK
jgi:hypothetical protein